MVPYAVVLVLAVLLIAFVPAITLGVAAVARGASVGVGSDRGFLVGAVPTQRGLHLLSI